MRGVRVLAQALLLGLSPLLAGCDSASRSDQTSAAAMSSEGKGWGEVAKKYPRDNEVEYSLKRGDCELSVTIGRLNEGQEVARVGLTTCPVLSYNEKLEGILLLLERAKDEGRLTDLRRVGPGPVGEMREGEIRKRLLQTTLDRLSDPEFVRQNPRLISRQGKRLDERYLFEEADAFREYKEIFQRIGYALEIEDYEGIVFSRVKRKDWPRGYKTALGEVLVPCNGMVYFRAEKTEPRPSVVPGQH